MSNTKPTYTPEALAKARELFRIKLNGEKAGGPPDEPEDWVGWYEVWLGDTMLAELTDADEGDQARLMADELSALIATALTAFAEAAVPADQKRRVQEIMNHMDVMIDGAVRAEREACAKHLLDIADQYENGDMVPQDDYQADAYRAAAQDLLLRGEVKRG